MKKGIIGIMLIGGLIGLYDAVSFWGRIDSPVSQIGSFILLDRYGDTIADFPQKDGYSISYTGSLDIPLIQNILEVEDRRFFEHHGIDIIGKAGAIIENYQAGGIVRGGSTITEQYIKNTYFPGAPRTLLQKIQEALGATLLEIKYDKETILHKYLDSIYMGNGLYGIESARRGYFPLASLEQSDDTMMRTIISRIKYPNPNPKALKYEENISEKLGLKKDIKEITITPRKSTNIFPLLTSRIKKERDDYCIGRQNTLETFVLQIPTNICTSQSITLRTSIDKNASIYAAKILEGTLTSLSEKNVHNGSIYVWSEKEKKIIIYIGNRQNSKDNAIDMIVRRRSVGSLLKPFVYLLAYEKGYSPNDYILDDVRSYGTEKENILYTPENYISKSYGPISLKEALGNSLNSATVRLTEFLGIGKIYEMFRQAGFDLDHDSGYYGYSISLGGVELSLENIITGYRGLTDLSDANKFLLYHTLEERSNRGRTFGISSILNTSIPLAVKTGTSTDFRDNWAIGYNHEIIIGVWAGNSDQSSMDDVSGITGAGPIYHAIAEYLISRGYIDTVDTPIPSGVSFEYRCEERLCLEKKGIYIRDGEQHLSKPKENKYFATDFITPLEISEKEKWKIQ